METIVTNTIHEQKISRLPVNMGAVTGLLPITGVPLPLVSFGGTALVVTLVGLGMLASVARDAARGDRRRRPASR